MLFVVRFSMLLVRAYMLMLISDIVSMVKSLLRNIVFIGMVVVRILMILLFFFLIRLDSIMLVSSIVRRNSSICLVWVVWM